MIGLDMLGAAEAPSQRALVLRVRNPLALAAKQGPAGTSFATMLIPDTVDAQVYNGMVKQMKKDFADRGADVEIQIVDAASVAGFSAPRSPGDLRALGFGAAMGALATFLLTRRK